MGKQHETIPNEPQEAPVKPEMPEIKPPVDPAETQIPAEAPVNEPVEVPPHPDSVAAELRNREHE